MAGLETIKNIPGAGIVLPLVVDGFVILGGVFMLGVLTTKIDNLGQKIDRISEARVAVLEQRVTELERFRDGYNSVPTKR